VLRWALPLALLVAAALPAPAAAPPVRVSEFVAECAFSHRNSDDPIVFPGEPGASHSHDFFGARSTNARTTHRSLRRSRTTCRPRADRSAYWVPTVLEGGKPVAITETDFYYLSRHADPTRVRLHPKGLRIIAGNAKATGPEDEKVAFWSCRGAGSESYQRIPDCPGDSRLELLVRFPDCWDGRRRDSRDHQRHMAYSAAGKCPRSHPVQVPEVQFKVLYATGGGEGVEPASGEGHTAHGDFFDGWSRPALRRRVEDCLRPRVKCGADGRPLD
jgi:hypothetical protein